jgi:hypothetical protein
MKEKPAPQCTCDEWMTYSARDMWSLAFAALHGVPTDSPPYRYCPWCGSELTVKEEEDETLPR